MARYNAIAESATAVASSTTFANIVCASSVIVKLRRLTIGVRAGATVPTSQQCTVSLARATARGTASTTQSFLPLDPNVGLAASSVMTGIDTAWSGNPTVAATTNYEFSFNTQSGWDAPFELLEEFIIASGTANGLALTNVGNALPASHLYTVGVEIEV